MENQKEVRIRNGFTKFPFMELRLPMTKATPFGSFRIKVLSVEFMRNRLLVCSGFANLWRFCSEEASEV
jgi:hypothetical protein